MADNASPPSSPKRGLGQWFWRSAELAQARQALQQLPRPQRAALTQARTALELGDVAFDPIDPLRSGPSLPLAVSLYREAAHWALLAQKPEPSALSPSEALASVAEETLLFAAGGSDGLAHVRTALATKTAWETAAEHPDTQRADAKALRAFAAALIERQLGPERRLGELRVQRIMRTVFGLLAAIGLVFGTATLVNVLSRGPDLAAGRPIHPSSANAGVTPEPHNFLFHTLDEDSPWAEVDLKKPTAFSVVDVTNRRDCCQDRALPSVIEVSSDHVHWKEVSRRTETYNDWHARFATTTARYVRVRVARHSVLHLAGIAVRAR